MHIHTPLLFLFTTITAVLTVGIACAWAWALVQKLRGRGVSYKTHGKFLAITYALTAVVGIFLFILIQQIAFGCADVSKHSSNRECYDLNELNWGWMSVGLVAMIGVVSVILLLLAFKPQPATKKRNKKLL